MLSATFKWLNDRENRYTILSVFFFAGLMFSKALLSITVGVFAVNWLFDPNIKEKIKRNSRNYPLFSILAIYFILVIGVFYSQNFSEAIKDLRIKLPLIVFPLIFATEKPFQYKNFKCVLNAFFIFLICSALVSFGIFLSKYSMEVRSISPFMNHIRLGILTTIGSFFMLYIFFKNKRKTNLYAISMLGGGLFLAFFTLAILGSVNGLIYFILMFFFWALVFIFFNRKTKTIFFAIPVFLFLIISPVYYVVNIHNVYFPKASIPHHPPTHTENGNIYTHLPELPMFENGNPVYMYYCETELSEEWNKRSNLNINDSALNAFPIRDVLLRYLASKNLTKDAKGVTSLCKQDIINIEKGITNYNLAGKLPLEHRLYELIQGYYLYKNFNDPNRNSLFMRFEFFKAALQIVKKHPFFGVGTGDVYSAFAIQYEEMNTLLEKKWQKKAHNQYMTMAVATGMVGLFFLIFGLIYPPVIKRKFKSFFFLTSYFILLMSMVSEDTIETQIGASIFSFFFAFFLFSEPTEKS